MYIHLHILLFVIFVGMSNAGIMELGENFSDIRKGGGYWLVKFYAPWCGHCKKLEPLWGSIAQALSNTNIMVGRINCHRFPSIATEFGIRGYPTIKFFTANADYTFNGDRDEENIIEFAHKMAGPPVEQIYQSNSLKSIMKMNNVFFMYVGEQKGLLWNIYYDVALKFQPYAYFYSTNAKIVIQTGHVPEVPSLFVYKENQMDYYTGHNSNGEENTNLNSSVYKWINEERFEMFPKVSRGNIHEIIQISKYVVLVIVQETKLEQIPVEMMEFRNMVENLVKKNRSKYHKNFQFGWVGSPELANSIAMQVLPLPHLLVLNSTNHHHYLPENDCSEMTADMIDIFLERINNQSVPAYGGDGYLIRIYRMYFDMTTSLAEMWMGNPILTIVLFGLPIGFLSFIMYSICCVDILENDDDENDESDHEKMD